MSGNSLTSNSNPRTRSRTPRPIKGRGKGKGSKGRGKGSGSQAQYNSAFACYDQWPRWQIVQLCIEQGLPSRGSKKILIQNLLAPDQEGGECLDCQSGSQQCGESLVPTFENLRIDEARHRTIQQEQLPEAEQNAKPCESVGVNPVAELPELGITDQAARPAQPSIMAAGVVDSSPCKRKADNLGTSEALARLGEEQPIAHQQQARQSDDSKVQQFWEKGLETKQHDQINHTGVEEKYDADSLQQVAANQVAEASQKESSEVHDNFDHATKPHAAADLHVIDSSCQLHQSDDSSTTQGTGDSPSSSCDASSSSGEDEKSKNVLKESLKELQHQQREREQHEALERQKQQQQELQQHQQRERERHEALERQRQQQQQQQQRQRERERREAAEAAEVAEAEEQRNCTEVRETFCYPVELESMCNPSAFSIQIDHLSACRSTVPLLYGDVHTRLQQLKDHYIIALQDSRRRGRKHALPVPECKGEGDALLVFAAASVAHFTTHPYPDFTCILACCREKEHNLLTGMQCQLEHSCRNLSSFVLPKQDNTFGWLRQLNDPKSRLARLAGACAVIRQLMKTLTGTEMQNMRKNTKFVIGPPPRNVAFSRNSRLPAGMHHKPGKTLLEAAFECSGKVAIVNAASGYHAGGGFLTGGRHALEEALCMQSTLYLSLAQAVELARAMSVEQARTNGLVDPRHKLLHIPDRGCVLSPDVAVLRHGTNKGYAQQDEVFRLACVLNVAMPNKNPCVHDSPYDSREGAKYTNLLQQKFKSVVNGALQAGADVLVVPDCGCGVFRNDPQRVGEELGCILRSYAHCFTDFILVGSDKFAQATLNSFHAGSPPWSTCFRGFSFKPRP